MGLFDDVVKGHSSWETVPEGEELLMGHRYQLSLELLGPYKDDTPQRIKAAIMAGAGLNNSLLADRLHLTQTVTIESVVVEPPQDLDDRLLVWPKFNVAVTFKKTGPGSPAIIILGIIVAVVLFALGMAFLILRRSVQHEVAQAPLSATPLILGLVLLAVVLVPAFASKR